jgi:NitT/TauT family transport system ATP-binding protein
MSNIPTQVRAVFEIDCPRPRRLIDLFENDRANQIKMEALSILHEEAMKSFSRGSKARPTSSTPIRSAWPRPEFAWTGF